MKVLQAGIAKSGNSWVYRIIEELYSEAELEHDSYIETDPVHKIAQDWDLSFEGQADIDVIDIEEGALFYRISSNYRRIIRDKEEYFGQTNHVWTHSFWRSRTPEVLDRVDKVVYVLRDPRDRFLSWADFLFTDYMQSRYPHEHGDKEEVVEERLEPQTEAWVEHVHGYLSKLSESERFVVFYEELASQPEATIRDLAGYLDLDEDDLDVGAVVERTSFSSMQDEDSEHFKKGRIGAWRRRLSPGEQRTVARIAGPLLEALGYPVEPTSENELTEGSGHLCGRPGEEELEAAIKRLHRYRLARNVKRGLRRGVRQLGKAL